MKRIHPHTFGLYSVYLAHQGSNCSRVLVGKNAALNRIVALPRPRNFYLCSSFFSGSPLAASSKSAPDAETGTTVNSGNNVIEPSSGNPDKKRFVKEGAVEMETRVSQMKDVETLLSFPVGRNLPLRTYCQIISALGHCVVNSGSDSERSKVLGDKRFADICTILRNAEYAEVPQLLLQALKGCIHIGMPSDDDLIKYLENELKWVVRRCPIKVVAKAIALFSSASVESNRVSKFNTKLSSSHPLLVAVDSLQRRFVELSTGGDFIAVFNVVSELNSATRAKIEDRAVDLVQEFSPMEMLKIFIALGHQKRRPTPLLRALAFHLSKSPEKIPAKDWIELMYAMNELSFCEPVLMAKMCAEIASEIPSISSPSVISSLVTSLGQLRYKNADVIQAVDEWIMKHDEELRPFDRAAWLLTSAMLNIRTENREKTCNSAKKVLTQESISNPLSWVNIVHSLLVLDQTDAKLLSTVLEPQFIAAINAIGKKATSAKLKILNINGATKLVKGYNGPLLSNGIIENWLSGMVSPTDKVLHESVVETLSNFLPPPKYLQPGRILQNGVFVDATCKLNEKLDPVPMDLVNKKMKTIDVAFHVQGYPMYTTGNKEPTGQAVLSVRLLQGEGFHVVAVPFLEFSPQEKLIRRVQYLEQKLRAINLVQSDSAEPALSKDR